ncbi:MULTISPECIES: SDR family oxidoreductase [Paenibacillus]|uniref:NAD(P)-dependent oxidoreductase n=1 Tax=Paenibacillus albilobatus TaxID=2716884 RepID=A0A920CCA9_9BACL|nr:MULTISPECIES: SDR family oxidoreductase [Paenibacillus]GIO34496.1 NAD(P)-dependent oxidoreductase [Paenibacillus albilobatus]
MYPSYPYYGSEVQCKQIPITFPPQQQRRQPGFEYLMVPQPIAENPNYRGSGKLANKIAVVTGGDSGIGRAVSIAFAKEGADVAVVYFDEHQDAAETKKRIESTGRRCLLISADLKEEEACRYAIAKAVETFGRIDVLVNNHGVQFPQNSILDISKEQLEFTFRTNIFSFFHLTKAALPYMKEGSSIINTASVTAYRGEKTLIDYSSTKGAIVSFTRSLSLNLTDQKIRVNGVAPGPIWTPLIPASFTPDRVKHFGTEVPMKRAGQPFELAPAYVYLASDDASYVSGQILHVGGGEMVES